jgi:sugar fermentation stimulation protein A
MLLPNNLIKASFIKRLNRFAMLAEVDGQQVLCHVANSGRLRELLARENTLWLTAAPVGNGRKTTHDLRLVEIKGVLVSADSRLPNHLLLEAIESNQLEEFAGLDQVRSEVTYGDSRLDLVLSGPDSTCFVEAKPVTLVENRVAMFPDAPTSRGRKHVLNLCAAVEEGYRAAVAFVVQRPDADFLEPSVKSDPELYVALLLAEKTGVEIYAYRCSVSMKEITISERIPVRLHDLA